ncbi:hypothetical protein JW905_10625 [bacterium]|nr:hypothetical protein [candidate division CSSED10-310 bacterium]
MIHTRTRQQYSIQILSTAFFIILAVGPSCSRADSLPPLILTTEPAADEDSVLRDVVIRIRIADDPASAPDLSGLDPDSLTVLLDGIPATTDLTPEPPFAWLVTVIPEEPFTSHHMVSVLIQACDLADNCMPPFQYTFTTGAFFGDHTPPQTANESPLDGATTVDPMAVVEITLNDRGAASGDEEISGIDPDSVAMYLQDEQVDISLTQLFIFGWKVRHIPAEPFTEGADIVAMVEATDRNGNIMVPFTWRFTIATPSHDDAPPVFSNLFPLPNLEGVPEDTTISFTVTDAMSGIEPSSLGLTINGESATGVLDIQPTQDGYHVELRPEAPFQPGIDVVVQAAAADLADNSSLATWRFKVRLDADTPYTIYPYDDSWLHPANESSQLNLWWLGGHGGDHFIIRIRLANDPEPYDLLVGPDAYLVDDSINKLCFPLTMDDWRAAHEVGPIEWMTAVADDSGALRSDFSPAHSFNFSHPTAVLLIAPADYAVLVDSSRPVFSWDPTAGGSQEYPENVSFVIGFVRVSMTGAVTDDVVTCILPNEVTSHQLSLQQWNQLQYGYWLWTAVTMDRSLHYGELMINHFIKVPDGP